MQNNNEQNKDKQTESPSANSEEFPSIFSAEETRDMVKEFLKAYLGGQITIRFGSADEFVARAKLEKTKLEYGTAVQQEWKTKLEVMTFMEICLGTKKASDEEKESALQNLVQFLIAARSSERVKGQFLTFDVEKRINELREDLDQTNRLVAEIMVFLRTFKQG